jgi:DNA-binding transcriptional MocR family regulator
MYEFSKAFESPRESPIRALFKHLGQPGMISLAGGYPDPALYDVAGLQEAADRAGRDSRACLDYGATDGTPRMKAAVVRLMAERGCETSPPHVIVTTGSQQAFDLVARVFLNPGDRVLVEQPTYPANIQTLRACQARIGSVRTDKDGLDVDALEETLARARADGALPKLIYTIPTFSNPSGATMTLERRLRLLELAVRHRCLIVEDDPYGGLRFSGEPVPSLLSLTSRVAGSSAWVVHLASLSKIVAPGLRVAWAVAPAEIIHRCQVAKQAADLGSSPWTQGIAAEYLASGRLAAHLRRICAVYADKCRALAAGLRSSLGDAIRFDEPAGGMFIWARLSGGLSADDLLAQAIPRNVMFVPGAGFQVEHPDASTLRLSFATPSLEDLAEASRRLGEALHATQSNRPPSSRP